MKPVEDIYPGTEREWDSFTITRTDFRRHWNGDLVSLFTLIQPGRTISETADFAVECTRKIASWVLENRERFGAEDRFQIVVAWPLSVRKIRRQIIKTGGTYKDIEDISFAATLRAFAGWMGQRYALNHGCYLRSNCTPSSLTTDH